MLIGQASEKQSHFISQHNKSNRKYLKKYFLFLFLNFTLNKATFSYIVNTIIATKLLTNSMATAD